jgi:hypothetical protein
MLCSGGYCGASLSLETISGMKNLQGHLEIGSSGRCTEFRSVLYSQQFDAEFEPTYAEQM